jgi:carbonic anhydrase
MKQLMDGLVRFQREIFPEHQELYRSLSSSQHPEILLLACSDSRVVPAAFLQAKPGDLFVCRNAGNIAPPHGEPSGGVSATIEYAVQVLDVKHVVVCGHSDCGAMRGIMHRERIAALPAVSKWLTHAERALAIVDRMHPAVDEATRLNLLIRENVLAQIANLMTHPCVAAKVRAGVLELHGWVFDISHGGFDIYDSRTELFKPLVAVSDTQEEVVHA